jgi:cytochrome b561
MTIRNTTVRWGHVSQFLHWLIVVLLIVQVALAIRANYLPLSRKISPLAWHKSVGITILALAVLRLLWRWVNPTPLLPGTLKPYERVLASFTHATLYILLFVMPLTGWMMSSARGFPVAWFGFFPKSWFGSVQLPDLVPKNKSLYDVMLTTHHALQWVLYTIVFLHVAAALKHHFLLKDDVLRRMLPFTENR